MTEKNKAAVALGRRRWAKLNAEERKALARAGGLAAWAGMTPQERSAEMRRRRRRV